MSAETAIYNSAIANITDGAISSLDDDSSSVREFLNLPTNESAGKILLDAWGDCVIFESFGKGFADRKAGRFFRRTPGSWYEPFSDIIGAATALIAGKVIDYAKPLIASEKKGVDEKLLVALRRARSRDFIESSLVYLSEQVEVTGLSSKWNATTEALPVLDGIADFSGNSIIIREALPDEFFKDPLPITAAELLENKMPENFLRFIGDLFPDPATRQSAVELLSLSITNIGQRTFAIWKGKCSNGKSLLGEVMRQLLGEFGGMLSGAALIRGDSGGKRFAASDLAGKRFVMAEEVSRPLDVEEVKRLTGGQPVKVEKKGMPEITIPANWLLVVSTNNMPRFEEAEKDPSGFLDRLFVLPFKVQFYANDEHRRRLIDQGGREELMRPQRDPREIISEIVEERARVIRYLIEIWFHVRKNKGRPVQSPECREAYNAYRIANDSIAEFVAQNFRYDPDSRVEYATITDRWVEYFGEKNVPSTQKIIKSVVEQYSKAGAEVYPVKGTHGARYLKNIALRADEPEPKPPEGDKTTIQQDKNISLFSSSSGWQSGKNMENPNGYGKKINSYSRLENAKNRHFATFADLPTDTITIASQIATELLEEAGDGGQVPLDRWRELCTAKGLTGPEIEAVENGMRELGLCDENWLCAEDVKK